MLFEDSDVGITPPQPIVEPHKNASYDWGRFIDSRRESSCCRPDSRLRVAAFCSFDFGFGALQEMARMHQALEIELVGIVTDDICDPKAKISWKKRTWRFYPPEERIKLFQRTQNVSGGLNVPFFSGSVKSTFFLSQLRIWSPDVILMYGFGQIIPEKVFKYPQFGMYNIHPSDIANKLYLGADPFGDMEKDEAISTVLTLHEVTENVDGGVIRARTKPIFFGQKVSTEWGALKNEMATIVPDGNKMVRQFLIGLRGESKMKIQKDQQVFSNSTQLELAVVAWRSAIGVEHVDTWEENLQIAETATFALERNVNAILYPLEQKEVIACVQIAGQFGQSIYPVSRGLNWEFGSKVPSHDTGIILDLSRMDGIIEYNEELAYVRIQPGVTHSMLYDFLQSRQSELWVAPTGAGLDTSVIGNALERGHGVTPYGDNISQISDLEVVLADGEVIRTGFGMYGNHRLSPIDRWGLGPSLDGLFSQSSLGIITSITLWLMPKPQASSMGYLTFSTTEDFLGAMIKLRSLKLQEAIRGDIVATNDWRMYHSEPSLMGPGYHYPMAGCYQDFTFNKWNIVFGLYGTPLAISETQATIKKQIEVVDSMRFFDDAPSENVTYPNEYCRAMHSIFSGVPGKCPSRMYFPKGKAPDLGVQPEADQCGIIWLTACSPFLQKDLSIARSIIEETFEGSGFVPDINIFCKRPRSLHYHIAMFYDRRVGDDERAMQCYRKLERKFFEAGYLPHRLGVHYGGVGLKQLDRVGALIASLKNTFDPKSVIGNGKYCALNMN